MKSDEEKLREMCWGLFKLKGRNFYMKYVKIVILALMEIIAEMYGNKNGGGK